MTPKTASASAWPPICPGENCLMIARALFLTLAGITSGFEQIMSRMKGFPVSIILLRNSI